MAITTESFTHCVCKWALCAILLRYQVQLYCLFIDIKHILTHSTLHSNPSSLHLAIKLIQMSHVRRWTYLCNIQIQSFHLVISSKPFSYKQIFQSQHIKAKSISNNATSLVNFNFCYMPKVFAKYSIHSVNRKVCYFLLDSCEVQLSAAWAWKNTHTFQCTGHLQYSPLTPPR